MLHKLALSTSSLYYTCYRSLFWRVLFTRLHGKEVALPSYARHSTWYISVRCWVLLDVEHGTEVSDVELCSTSYMVQHWALSSSVCNFTWYFSGVFRVLDILHGSQLGAAEFCSTFYMVQKWTLSNSALHFSSYISRLRPFLLAILHGTEFGAAEFGSMVN